MDKKTNLFFYSLFTALAFLPLGSALVYCFGYRLVLFHYLICCILLALICIGCTASLLSDKAYTPTRLQKLLAWTMPLLALVNWFFYISAADNAFIIIPLLICFICTLIISITHSRSIVLKILPAVLAALLILPLSFLSLFASIGQNTVVRTVLSPDQHHYAEVVDSDQGALGGNTVVCVYENSRLNLGVFSIEDRPETVYIGPWGEFDDLPVSWKDNETLIVRSTEYPIS